MIQGGARSRTGRGFLRLNNWHLELLGTTKKLFTLLVKTTKADRYHFKMLFSAVAILAAASGLLSLSSAHNIQMKAHSRECFHEQLHKDDKMTVTFQVGDREFGGSGSLEVDFWVY